MGGAIRILPIIIILLRTITTSTIVPFRRLWCTEEFHLLRQEHGTVRHHLQGEGIIIRGRLQLQHGTDQDLLLPDGRSREHRLLPDGTGLQPHQGAMEPLLPHIVLALGIIPTDNRQMWESGIFLIEFLLRKIIIKACFFNIPGFPVKFIAFSGKPVSLNKGEYHG